MFGFISKYNFEKGLLFSNEVDNVFEIDSLDDLSLSSSSIDNDASISLSDNSENVSSQCKRRKLQPRESLILIHDILLFLISLFLSKYLYNTLCNCR